MRYGLIGQPLAHSVSPRLHALLGLEDYVLCPLLEDELKAFFQKRDFAGVNVTIPYKQAVIPYLDEISDRAKEIGAVNTIRKNADGTLFGDNTDFAGFSFLAARTGVALYGQKALVLGTGGTAHTVRAVLRAQGAREVISVSRTGACNYQNVYQHEDADVIINTTPVGMYPKFLNSPLDVSRFPVLQGVLDVVYNPLETALVRQARSLGIRASGGLPMLVEQARAAEEVFLSKRIQEAEVQRVLAVLSRDMSNIVLIGMPGSGKSTLGKLTAQALSRQLLDTDAMISTRAGMPVSEIFERFGEEHFRALEEAAVSEACATGGKVIAVGGGAVLSEKNRAAMRMNGRIYLIDRPLEKLARSGRPLSKSTQVLEAMRVRRAPIYQALCDRQIENTATLEQALRLIREDFDAYTGR